MYLDSSAPSVSGANQRGLREPAIRSLLKPGFGLEARPCIQEPAPQQRLLNLVLPTDELAKCNTEALTDRVGLDTLPGRLAEHRLLQQNVAPVRFRFGENKASREKMQGREASRA